MKRPAAAAIASCALLSTNGCLGASRVLPPAQSAAAPYSVVATGLRPEGAPWAGKIKHVVIIFQENRTPDNVFNGFPGADTQTWGLDHNGHRIPLAYVSETAPYDLSHTHHAFLREYDNGKLDGFDREVSTVCLKPGACPPKDRRAYGMMPRYQSQPYWDMARQYAMGDRMFQTNEGPSFPAHQYIISGTSTILNGSNLRAGENPIAPNRQASGGCDSPKGSLVTLIDEAGRENQQQFPCFERIALMDLLIAKHVDWHYYQYSYVPNFWSAVDAIRHLHELPTYRVNVVAPSARVITDALNGDLEPMTWVTPDLDDSDHARVADGSGPSWVTSIVNAIGTSKYWKDTAIFVTWDDWGGWYDHVKPPRYNSYELGFRVPLIVISPYAKHGFVSHAQHEFGSILKFAEETFNLGSMGTTDVRADDLADCFDFTQTPRTFHPIHAPVGPKFFLNKPPSTQPPDDDF